MATPLKTIKSGIKHWYLLLIVGLLYIAVGIWVFVNPSKFLPGTIHTLQYFVFSQRYFRHSFFNFQSKVR